MADVPVLDRIAKAAYAPYLPRLGFEPPPMHQDFAADLAADALWVAGDPAEGFIVARPKGDDWLLENVARAPDAPRGLGRMLIAHGEAEGRERSFPRVILYTHARMTENRALYPRLGYTEIDVRDNSGIDRVFFAKPL